MMGRRTWRTYATKSFATQFGQDSGHPSRYIYRVFDEVESEDDDELEWTSAVIFSTPQGRKQVQLHVARSAGSVRRIRGVATS